MRNRRLFNRIERKFRLEHGPFSSLIDQENLSTSILKNLSGGGLLFCAKEQYSVGSQIFLKVHVSGWNQEKGGIKKVADSGSEVLLETIAEVLHVDSDQKNCCFWIGAKFLAQVHN